MQRDKRGRFIKKASGGTKMINGKLYKAKPEAAQAFATYQLTHPDATEDAWLASPEGQGYLEEITAPSLDTNSTFNNLGFKTYTFGDTPSFKFNGTYGLDPIKHKLALREHETLGLKTTFGAPQKIKVKVVDGKYIDLYGREVPESERVLNPQYYDVQHFDDTPTLEEIKLKVAKETEKSAGMNITDPIDLYNNKNNPGVIDKTKIANFLDFARAGIGASVNNKIANRALAAEKPFLQDVSESHRAIYGDYRALVQGELAAAKLRNMASKPMTSDGALLQQMMLDAQIKGQEYIDQGNAKDDAMIKLTREVAWQQEKENQQLRLAVAMLNRQAMLMSEKNKANILNSRDSANYSQVVAPLLGGIELRLRNEGKELKAYLDYYDNAIAEQNVWNSYDPGLTDVQKELRNKYLLEGATGVTNLINSDQAKYENEWLGLKQLMGRETLRRLAAIKGATINFESLNVDNTTPSFWDNTPSTLWKKKGGTIYKAKLSKRVKDNDRGAKSIESSKKIAAKLLEKAIDALYDYKDVEIIAKPKKRKYLAGGGLPFVGHTPVFATSESGAPATAKTKSDDKEDLTTKDVLTLLKDMDGLPSDMLLIVSSLKNFTLLDSMDPLGLSSSSSIEARYIDLINKVKIAKFNREEYNQAFNLLKSNGGLNEYAITSEGYLIGTNQEGDFLMFTPDLVNAGEPKNLGYSLLTNSNLLYLRANSTDAAFNHKLTTVALNGIGMEVITEQINKIVLGLGSSKESEEGFLKMGQKGQVKEGLKFLQKAMKEVGDNSLNDNMSVADYYQAGYLTEDLASLAQMALLYIWAALPANAKSMLLVKGGSTKGAEALLQSLVYSKTSTETLFKASPKKMTKSLSSSKDSSDGVDELKLSPVLMMQVGYTDHMPITLLKGTKYAMTVNALVLPITDVNKKLLGVTTLDKVAESTFGGALDMNNVTMGSQLIDPQALQNVQIDSTNLYVMNLPIDKNSTDGTIKPDLAWMSKIEQIDELIRAQNITDIQQINQLYVEAGLPVLMDNNGQLNTKDYCKFGVLNGHALNTAFKDLDLLDNTVLELDDEDQINNVMSILNKGRSEKDRIDFDSESLWDSIFGTSHNSIYEGTIYIPVRTNAFTGMIGGGQYPDTETAAEVEALIQQKERVLGYVDPGLLI